MAIAEMPTKQIMTPVRVAMLKEVANRKWDATMMFLVNKSEGKDEKYVQRAVERFAEYGLIRFTGGGEFVITNKGRKYLGMDPKEEE